jgi:hypothetical protein
MKKILSGRRRCIVSGSDVTAMTRVLNAMPWFSASYHSTSSCDIPGMVYYDFDEQDINYEADICKYMNMSASFFQDYGYSVMPDYPPRPTRTKFTGSFGQFVEQLNLG